MLAGLARGHRPDTLICWARERGIAIFCDLPPVGVVALAAAASPQATPAAMRVRSDGYGTIGIVIPAELTR